MFSVQQFRPTVLLSLIKVKLHLWKLVELLQSFRLMNLIYCSSYLYKFGLLIYIILNSILKYALRLKLLKHICYVQERSFQLYNSKRKGTKNCIATDYVVFYDFHEKI